MHVLGQIQAGQQGPKILWEIKLHQQMQFMGNWELGKEAMKSERTTGDIRVANIVISCTGTTIPQVMPISSDTSHFIYLIRKNINM